MKPRLIALLCLAGLAAAPPALAHDDLPALPSAMSDEGGRDDDRGRDPDRDRHRDDRCTLQLIPPPAVRYRGALSRGYHGRSSRMHAERAALDVGHRGDTCSYAVRIEPDGGPGPAFLHSGGDRLAFSIVPAGQLDGSDSNVVEVSASIPRGQPRKSVPFQIVIPPGQSVRAGRYNGRVEATLFEEDGGRREFVARQSLEVFADVAPRVTASFGQDAHAGVKSMTLDFGELMQGQAETLYFSVDANTLYSISMLSQNEGELRHEFTEAGIAYEVRLDGKRVEPAAATPTPILTGSSDEQHGMQISVTGRTAGALAGKYSDRLTLVITAD